MSPAKINYISNSILEFRELDSFMLFLADRFENKTRKEGADIFQRLGVIIHNFFQGHFSLIENFLVSKIAFLLPIRDLLDSIPR